jgi:hypothetical protein
MKIQPLSLGGGKEKLGVKARGREGERNWPDGRGLNNIAGVRYQKKKKLTWWVDEFTRIGVELVK